MSKHTPGPWKWDVERERLSCPNDGRTTWPDAVGPERMTLLLIGEVDGIRPYEADARLIAAAPELLAALRKALRCECWEGDMTPPSMGSVVTSGPCDECRAAEVLIKRIEGDE